MKKKRFEKLFALLLCGVCAALPLTGCGAIEDKADVLYIHINRAGNGDKFVYALAEKFTEIYGKQVEISSTTVNDLTRTKLKSGPKNNNVDLFLAIDQVFDLIAMGRNALPGYDSIFADLSDVYESNGYHSDVTVKDFINDEAYNYHTVDGKQWTLPYLQNITGLVYNEDIFTANGIEEAPRT
ncbi:MAG: hypothetical protein ACI4SH_02495, partial [Candidatus Scatosoma sp.]